jgi:Site-specific recombinases, DNA invertase Pin homologs
MSRRAFIYARISQDRSAEGLGVQRQEEVCRQFAASHGLEVVEVYSDNDVSAFSGRTRPEYDAMLHRLKAREVEAVICWRMDRLHRRPVELESYAELCTNADGSPAVLTYAVTGGGEINLSSADGLLRAGIMGQVARFESNTKRERARAKAAQKAAAGEWLGGVRPFGWDVVAGKLVLNEAEATELERAHHDVLEGRSLWSIIRRWNDPEREGGPLTTTYGKPWGHAQLRQALLRSRNCGLYEFRGEVLSRDVVPPIVSEDIWRGVVSVLSDPARRTNRGTAAQHIVSGVAQCHCGAVVKAGNVYGRKDKVTGEKVKHTAYICTLRFKGKGHIGKRKEYVDRVVEMAVYRALAAGSVEASRKPETLARAATVKAELAALSTKEAEAGAALADGSLTFAQLAAFNNKIAAQRKDFEAELATLGAEPAVAVGTMPDFTGATARVDDLFREWLSSPVEDRRDFIRSRFHVVLFPHRVGSPRVFDPNVVVVVPRSPGDGRGPLSPERIADLKAEPMSDAMLETLERWPSYREGGGFDRSRFDNMAAFRARAAQRREEIDDDE